MAQKPKSTKQFAGMALSALDKSQSANEKVEDFEAEAYYAANPTDPTDGGPPNIGATLNAAIKATMKSLAHLERCREVHREMKRAKGSSAA